MPQISINDNEIEQAEKILLKEGQSFDEERCTFIKNLDSIDCQAVPGSGKTTTLLAKLLILEKHLPLEHGAGILVLSHTNTAVNEIKNRIAKYCPKLFAYPNYIGTIQTFTDTFLTIPYYSIKYGHRLNIIDTNYYKKTLENNLWIQGGSNEIKRKTAAHLIAKQLSNEQILYLDNILIKGKKLEITKPTKYKKDYTEEERLGILNCLKNRIKIAHNNGILAFEDSYILASEYLEKYPFAINILSKRFKYIFVDEMQDSDVRQYELLEKIFSNSAGIYQRIGDINQAIFDADIKDISVWKLREESKSLPISKTMRLNKNITKIVNNLALNNNYKIASEINIGIKPRIITYNDETIENVIPYFKEKIIALRKTQIYKSTKPSKEVYKAIAWSYNQEEGKNQLRLPCYFPAFNKNIPNNKKQHFNALKEQLEYAQTYAKKSNCLKEINKNIVDILLEILRLEEIKNGNDRFYTKYSITKYLREATNFNYSEYERDVYILTQKTYRQSGINKEILLLAKKIITNVLTCFNKTINKSKEFIEGPIFAHSAQPGEVESDNNILNCDGFKIEIGSIHSVKGETHTATLVMETEYYDTESKKLLDLLENRDNNKRNPRKVEAMKMMYVAMSRPTHLLCFACNENNIKGHEQALKDFGWKIEKAPKTTGT